MKFLCVEDYKKVKKLMGDNCDKITSSNYKVLKDNCVIRDNPLFLDNARPIWFFVTMRTDTTNEVIIPKHRKFYVDCSGRYKEDHTLEDAVILSAKRFIDNFVLGTPDEIREVIYHTALSPLGACIIDSDVFVYISIIIDSNLKNDEHFKLNDCRYEHIKNLTYSNYLELEMIKKLVLVKENEK